MDEKVINDLKKFIGKEVKEVRKDHDTLILGFEKKILFIRSMKRFSIAARESLDHLSLKALDKEILKDAEVQKNDFLVLSFQKENEPVFKLGIKVNTLTEVK